MDILALSGSLRTHSYNTALLRSAVRLKPAEVDISLFNSLAGIPLFNPDIEETAIPETVTQLRKSIDHADAIIISTPEYAHGVPGTLKNALDWFVSFNEIILKPIAVMSVSTSGLGGYRAHTELVKVLHAMHTNIIIEASLNVPFAKMKFDTQGELVDPNTLTALKISLSRIVSFVQQQ